MAVRSTIIVYGFPLLSSSCFSKPNSSIDGVRRTHLRFQVPSSCKAIKWYNVVKTGDLMMVRDEEKNNKLRRAATLANATDVRRRAVLVRSRAERLEGGILIGTESSIVLPERMKVVILMAFVMFLCNADRVIMSVAIVPLAAKYGWNNTFAGIVQSSFLWGYVLSSAVGGAIVDRYGGKRIMAWGVAIWSLMTLLTPWAAQHSLAMLLTIRTLFGLAEGIAIPSMNTLLFRWFPCHEFASAVGFSMAGFHLGNVAGLLLAPLLMMKFEVSGPFVLFSMLGLLWLPIWANHVTNDPRESDTIHKMELQLIQARKADNLFNNNGKLPPFHQLSSSLPIWATIFANVTNNWGYFVLLSWMPLYFKSVFNVNLKQAAWFSAIPWGTMAASGYLAGAASDYLIREGYSIILVRKIMQSIGFIGPGISLLCLNFAKTPTVASIILTVGLSLSSFSQAGYLLNIQDIAPEHAGLLHGIANSIGTVAAISSTIGIGYFVQWLGSFQAFLNVTAALYFATTIFWNLHASGERVL